MVCYAYLEVSGQGHRWPTYVVKTHKCSYCTFLYFATIADLRRCRRWLNYCHVFTIHRVRLPRVITITSVGEAYDAALIAKKYPHLAADTTLVIDWGLPETRAMFLLISMEICSALARYRTVTDALMTLTEEWYEDVLALSRVPTGIGLVMHIYLRLLIDKLAVLYSPVLAGNFRDWIDSAMSSGGSPEK